MSQSAVYVIFPDAELRSSLRFLLEAYGLTVFAFAKIEDFLAAHEPGSTGCLVLPRDMPGRSGTACLARLRRKALILPTVIVADVVSDRLSRRAARLGAVVVDSLAADTVVEAVRRALSAGPNRASDEGESGDDPPGVQPIRDFL